MIATRKELRFRPCLSGESSKCKGVFETTKEIRICVPCKMINERELAMNFDEEKEDLLEEFWCALK